MPRLPELLDRDALPDSIRTAYDFVAKSRGQVSPSYAVMLHAPEMASRICHLGTKFRFESSLTELTIELLAYVVSCELDNGYEGAIHGRAATRLGVDPGVVDAIRAKAPVPATDGRIALPIACARELVRTHHRTDALFADAHRAFGDEGVVELVGTIGYYAMLALTHNALQVRVPQG